ncbi:hypothetical protein CDV31_016331 [Fusarium ambrosium]|uniref:Secreted LysM effector LysM C-terminal domain-containing protein n=1 Tax=Fusarium ambrosium TaxID=131363 RepID=A0A428SB03_9HYPO|nr:hypothetical protein CDV31_016331 [Fusarium ambrosium]
MRLSFGAALLAFSPAVLGWRLTMYSQKDCNDYDGDFSYYVLKGTGKMTYCVGLGAEAWEIPEGVTCGYYTQNGAVGPEDCHGQMKEALSFKVGRGTAQFWAEFDTDDWQRIDVRCSGRFGGFPRAGNDGSDFRASTECRNTYYHNDGDKIELTAKGFMAWD